MSIDIDQMRHLLRRICKNATKNAVSKGFDIDFEKCLCICANHNSWTMHVLDKRAGTFYACNAKDTGNCMTFGAEFMRYVPSIDRFDGLDYEVCAQSPIAMTGSSKVLLPVADEFAYKFPPKAIEMMFKSLMMHGASVMIANPQCSEANRQIAEFSKKMKNDLKSKAKKLGVKSFAYARFVKNALHSYDETFKRLGALRDPIEVDILPHPFKTVEELTMFLDLQGIE